jgi:hypothetical protein
MVGTRRNLLTKTSSYGNGNGIESNQRDDIETGYGTINNIKPTHRFRDAIKQTMYTNRANDMKRKLIDNVDHEQLEIYRKSAESVREYGFFAALNFVDTNSSSSNAYPTRNSVPSTKSRTAVSMTGSR